MFEKVIFDSLYDYFVDNKLLTTRPSGFIKVDLCVDQLLAITHEIHTNLDANPSIDTIGVFLDMSKTWHNALICKLKSYGIQPNLPTLVSNYRCNRQQRVVVNGITSSWKSISSGIPKARYWVLSFFLISLMASLVCMTKIHILNV